MRGIRIVNAFVSGVALLTYCSIHADAQTIAPSVIDPNLSVRAVATGLTTPTTIIFLGSGDFLVAEKNTGRVRRVVNGGVGDTVLDLAVNSGSERGLLGMALHPNFAANGYVYLYWTESPTGADSNNLADLGSIWFDPAPLRTNRVDRFVWDGSALAWDLNLIRLRSYQADAGQQLRRNHDGGVIQFGLDGKLYVIIGDVGRRGQTQNLPTGPRRVLLPHTPRRTTNSAAPSRTTITSPGSSSDSTTTAPRPPTTRSPLSAPVSAGRPGRTSRSCSPTAFATVSD